MSYREQLLLLSSNLDHEDVYSILVTFFLIQLEKLDCF